MMIMLENKKDRQLAPVSRVLTLDSCESYRIIYNNNYLPYK